MSLSLSKALTSKSWWKTKSKDTWKSIRNWSCFNGSLLSDNDTVCGLDHSDLPYGKWGSEVELTRPPTAHLPPDSLRSGSAGTLCLTNETRPAQLPNGAYGSHQAQKSDRSLDSVSDVSAHDGDVRPALPFDPAYESKITTLQEMLETLPETATERSFIQEPLRKLMAASTENERGAAGMYAMIQFESLTERFPKFRTADRLRGMGFSEYLVPIPSSNGEQTLSNAEEVTKSQDNEHRSDDTRAGSQSRSSSSKAAKVLGL